MDSINTQVMKIHQRNIDTRTRMPFMEKVKVPDNYCTTKDDVINKWLELGNSEGKLVVLRQYLGIKRTKIHYVDMTLGVSLGSDALRYDFNYNRGDVYSQAPQIEHNHVEAFTPSYINNHTIEKTFGNTRIVYVSTRRVKVLIYSLNAIMFDKFDCVAYDIKPNKKDVYIGEYRGGFKITDIEQMRPFLYVCESVKNARSIYYGLSEHTKKAGHKNVIQAKISKRHGTMENLYISDYIKGGATLEKIKDIFHMEQAEIDLLNVAFNYNIGSAAKRSVKRAAYRKLRKIAKHRRVTKAEVSFFQNIIGVMKIRKMNLS